MQASATQIAKEIPDAELVYDLLIVGGGINGAGIARDAAGRGLSVLLVEQDDLASHTSSASTKLIHGGLRYLEYGELRLVREALIERERLMGMAGHIIWPLRFVLPQAQSPRPAWMVRLGLFLYDHLGGRKALPATQTLNLDRCAQGEPLRHLGKHGRGKAYVYSDCWVEDSRLVVLNAMDAAARGARIETRTRLADAHTVNGLWHAALESEGLGSRVVRARMLVNAAGPWVESLLKRLGRAKSDRGVRLVKGSHIVVPRLYEGEHAFLLQNPDRRVIFTVPYEGQFTLIGTTDLAWTQAPGKAQICPEETAYLCTAVSRYFAKGIEPRDVVWSYAGIRPLYDDHAANASAVTRDYVLDLDTRCDAAPLLSVFGGKITTYRRLAEHALEQIGTVLPLPAKAWTAGAVLPGGDFAQGDFASYEAALQTRYPDMPHPLLHRLARAYGTGTEVILGEARTTEDLGERLGGDLFAREAEYLVRHEWARTPEDILWRRSKLGLHCDAKTSARLAQWLAAQA